MAIKRKGPAGWRVHPGEVLREEFLKPRQVSPYRVAKAIGVSAPTVNDIVLERRAISAEMAARLAVYLGTSEQFWMNLQTAYDVSRIKQEKATELRRIRPLAEELRA